MPPSKNACGWKGCTEEASTEVLLDAGASTCETCGQDITERRTYKLCKEHSKQYTDSADVTLLLLSAKEA